MDGTFVMRNGQVQRAAGYDDLFRCTLLLRCPTHGSMSVVGKVVARYVSRDGEEKFEVSGPGYCPIHACAHPVELVEHIVEPIDRIRGRGEPAAVQEELVRANSVTTEGGDAVVPAAFPEPAATATTTTTTTTASAEDEGTALATANRRDGSLVMVLERFKELMRRATPGHCAMCNKVCGNPVCRTCFEQL